MKILIATPLTLTQSGGPAQYAVQLARELEKAGHTTKSIAFTEVAHLPSILKHLALMVRIYMRSRNVDVVLVLDTFSMGLPAVLASLISGKKTILRVGGDFLWEHYVERTKHLIPLREFYRATPSLSLKERAILSLHRHVIVPHAHRILFSTTWQRDIWEKPYGLRGERTSIVENAYAYSHTKESFETHERGAVVWIGRDLALKNVARLESAIELVRKKYPSLRFMRYTNTSHDTVHEVLSQSRFLVLPSLSEVSPNLVFEALSYGTPVILTRECGVLHELQNAVTVIDPMRTEDIASRVEELMTREGYTEAYTEAIKYTPSRTYKNVADDILRTCEDISAKNTH